MAWSPAEVLEVQALRLRRRWQDPGSRRAAGALLPGLSIPEDAQRAWLQVLAGTHPFAGWLGGDEPWSACPQEFPDGLTRRVLVTCHPFLGGAAWSSPPTSPGY